MVISYVVSNASWAPLYDVRAFSNGNSVQVDRHTRLHNTFVFNIR